MESIQGIKQRFGIIGNDTGLNRALEKTIQVAPTDISVLVTGESGVGKTTLIDLFAGLVKPIKGEILLNGKNEILLKQLPFRKFYLPMILIDFLIYF